MGSKRRVAAGLEDSSEDEDKPLARMGSKTSRDTAEQDIHAAQGPRTKRLRSSTDCGPLKIEHQPPAADNAAKAAAEYSGEPAPRSGQVSAAQHTGTDAPESAADTAASTVDNATPFAAAGAAAALGAHEALQETYSGPELPAESSGGLQRRSCKRQAKQPPRLAVQSSHSTRQGKAGSQKPPKELKEGKPTAHYAHKDWADDDEDWGRGRDTRPDVEQPAELPTKEQAVGWCFWQAFEHEDSSDDDHDEPEQLTSKKQQRKAATKVATQRWYRGVVFHYVPEESEYWLAMEDGDFNKLKQEFEEDIQKADVLFCKPPKQLHHHQQQTEQKQPVLFGKHESAAEDETQQAAAATSGNAKKRKCGPAKQQQAQQQQQEGNKEGEQQQQQVKQQKSAAADATSGLEKSANVADADAALVAIADPEALGPPQPKQQQQPSNAKQSAQQRQRQQQQQGQSGKAAATAAAGSKPAMPKSAGTKPAAAAAAEAAGSAAEAASTHPTGPQLNLSELTPNGQKLAEHLHKLQQLHEQVDQLMQQEVAALQELLGFVSNIDAIEARKDVSSRLSADGKRLFTVVSRLSKGTVFAEKQDRLKSLANQCLGALGAFGQAAHPTSSAGAATGSRQQWQAGSGAQQKALGKGQQQQHQRRPIIPVKTGQPEGGRLQRQQQGSRAGIAAAAAGKDAACSGSQGLQQARTATPQGTLQPPAAPGTATAGVTQPGTAIALPPALIKEASLTELMESYQHLVPIQDLEDPLRNKAVSLLSALLHPPVAISPFVLGHQLEKMLHEQHGSIGTGRHMYLRHLYMILCVLGIKELAAAAEAAHQAEKAAQAAAAAEAAVGSAGNDLTRAARVKHRTAEAAVAAARATLDGMPGVADAAAVRSALLDGSATVVDLFEMTCKKLGFDQQRDK